MPLFILSAGVSKHDAHSVTTSIMQGYRVAKNEAEAKGLFLPALEESKPGFSIDQLLCLEIPEGALRAGLMECD